MEMVVAVMVMVSDERWEMGWCGGGRGWWWVVLVVQCGACCIIQVAWCMVGGWKFWALDLELGGQ